MIAIRLLATVGCLSAFLLMVGDAVAADNRVIHSPSTGHVGRLLLLLLSATRRRLVDGEESSLALSGVVAKATGVFTAATVGDEFSASSLLIANWALASMDGSPTFSSRNTVPLLPLLTRNRSDR